MHYKLKKDDIKTNSALPIRSSLGDQGLLRRLFEHFWSPFGLPFWKKSLFRIQLIDYSLLEWMTPHDLIEHHLLFFYCKMIFTLSIWGEGGLLFWSLIKRSPFVWKIGLLKETEGCLPKKPYLRTLSQLGPTPLLHSHFGISKIGTF